MAEKEWREGGRQGKSDGGLDGGLKGNEGKREKGGIL
jgi:hypothetical protein